MSLIQEDKGEIEINEEAIYHVNSEESIILVISVSPAKHHDYRGEF